VIITVVYDIFRLIGYYLWNEPKTITCVKGKGKGVPVRAMKAYIWSRSTRIASLILSLGAKWRWVVHITPRPNGKMGGPQNWSGSSWRENLSLGCPARSLITITNTISRLLVTTYVQLMKCVHFLFLRVWRSGVSDNLHSTTIVFNNRCVCKTVFITDYLWQRRCTVSYEWPYCYFYTVNDDLKAGKLLTKKRQSLFQFDLRLFSTFVFVIVLP
jgi:hypothetical protein